MNEITPLVFVVDDDPSVRRAIKRLVGSVGLQVELLESARDFLQAKRPDVPSCLVLDIRLRTTSGLDLQRELTKANIPVPVIFITAHGDIPMTVRAMKAGAVEFLTKPFRDQDLLDAIQIALKKDRARREREAEIAARLHKRIEVIPDEAVQAMTSWKWPGNIRELENFIERSVILTDGDRLNAPLAELREEISRQPSDSDVTLRDRERAHIIEILRQTRGALSGPAGAAARLGLKRTTLQYKMQRLGISRTDFLH
jgi:DNA-binding NtrC family response regulator